MQILDDQQQRLSLGFASEELGDGIDGACESKLGIHGTERLLIVLDLQQGVQIRQRCLKARIEVLDVRRDLGPPHLRAVGRIQAEIIVQEGDDRDEWRLRAVGDGEGFKDFPSGADVSLQLEDQPRLADARFGDDRHDLPRAAVSATRCLREQLPLAIATDELGQASAGGALQPRPERPQSVDFIDLYGFDDAFDLGRPQEAKREVPFDQIARAFADDDCTRVGERLDAGGQVHRVPNRRVLGVSLARPDRSDDDFARVDARSDL